MNVLIFQHNSVVCIQDDSVKKDSLEEDIKPRLSDHVQNGFCKKDLGHELKVNGLTKNGYCNSGKGNGMITTVQIKNGQCLVADDHLVKNGFVKNGHWKAMGDDVVKNGINVNGYCGVMRRRPKDVDADDEGDHLSEGHRATEDEQHSKASSSTDVTSPMSDAAPPSHIKVGFWCPIIDVLTCSF